MSKGTLALVVVIAVLAVGATAYFVIRNNADSNTQPQELVVTSWGGAYQDAQRAAIFEPFEQAHNVKIREESYIGDLAKIKAMVESGNVSWDVVAVESPMMMRGISENLYEPIDTSQMPIDELLPQAIGDYGIAVIFWSTVIGYSTDQYGEDDHPNNWAEFWDVETFPGPRALRNWPIATLELALLADGVALDQLYPLDVDRAFTSLDRIKDHIEVWWETGEQPSQLLSSGEVYLSSGWNGRLFDARMEGQPVMETFSDGLVDADWWVIPRGSNNKDLAMQFIAFASQAAQQEKLATLIPYGPVNTTANANLPEDVAKHLPTYPANLAQQTFIDSAWWDQNYDVVLQRWQAWLLQ